MLAKQSKLTVFCFAFRTNQESSPMAITTKPALSPNPALNLNIAKTDAQAEVPTEAAAPAPAAPAVATAEPKKSWLQKTEAKVHHAAEKMFSKPAVVGGAHTFGSPDTNFNIQASISERVALQPNDELLKEPNRAAAKGVKWTQLKVNEAVGAQVGIAGGTFGLGQSTSIEVIAPTSSNPTGKTIVELVKEQNNLAHLKLSADDLRSAAPGTEVTFSKARAASVGVTGELPGTGAEVKLGREVSKSVLVGQDQTVHYAMGKSTTVGASAHVGVSLEETAIPVGPNSATLVVGFDAEKQRTLEMSGHFDLKTDAGKAAYNFALAADPKKLAADPEAAKAALQKYGMMTAYVADRTTAGFGAKVALGGAELLSIGSHSSTTKSQLLQVNPNDQQVIDSTSFVQKQYTTSATGILPRLAAGEERKSLVSMVSVSKNGEAAQRAMLHSLQVTDPKVTDQENHEVANFISSMGVKTDQKATGTNGKGSMSVQIALTEDAIGKLDAQTTAAFTKSVEDNIEKLEGRPLPWNDASQSKRNPAYRDEQFKEPGSIKTRFDEALRDESNLGTNGMTHDQVVRDYRNTTGRDFEKDLSTQKSLALLAEGMDKARGKAIDGRGPLLSALSKLNSPTMRATLVSLHNDVGAGLVGLEYSGNGLNVRAQAETPAPVNPEAVAQAALDS